VDAFTRPTGEGLIGIFLDRAFGLVPAAPIMALLAFGAGVAMRWSAVGLLTFAPIPYLVLVSFLDWTGGWNPQARYFAVLTPLAVVLLALALQHRLAQLAAIPLGIWTLGQSLAYVVAPALRYDTYAAPPLVDLAWLRLGITPSGAFPLFGCCGSTTTVLAIAWSALLVVLAALGAASGRRVTPASH
jgi:hypothetical protein